MNTIVNPLKTSTVEDRDPPLTPPRQEGVEMMLALPRPPHDHLFVFKRGTELSPCCCHSEMLPRINHSPNAKEMVNTEYSKCEYSNENFKCFLNTSKTPRICFQNLQLFVSLSLLYAGLSGCLPHSYCNEWREAAMWPLRFRPHRRNNRTEGTWEKTRENTGFLYSPNDTVFSLWLQITSLKEHQNITLWQ